MEDTCKLNNRPPLPTVKDTIQILNKTNQKPLIPTINETVPLHKPCSQVLNKKLNEVDKTKIALLKSDKSNKVTEARLFIEKKRKERAEKTKLELLQKKKIAEERKYKLDQLQKTTKELAKVHFKPKVVHVQDNCKIGIYLPPESKQPEVDLTWSPPPKIKSVKKPKKITKNIQNQLKVLDTTYDIGRCLNITKDIINTTPTSPVIKKCENTIKKTKLIEKEPQLYDITKPEYLFTELKLNNDDYQLIDKHLLDISTPKIINIDTSLVQKDHSNVLIEEIWYDNERQQNGDYMPLNREISDINLNIKPIDTVHNDTETYTALKFTNRSHEEIMKSIDHLTELQKLLIDQCLPNKKFSSESTQTDNYDNLLTLFTSKSPPPPINFISVLKCKQNLQQAEKKDLEINTFDNLNEYSTSNDLHCTIINEYNKSNIPDVVECDKMEHSLNHNHNKHENDLNEYKSSIINETIELKSNSVCLNYTTENNICEEKTNIIKNDKFITSNIISNENIKQLLEKNNSNSELLIKNKSDTNDIHNTCIHLKNDDNSSVNKAMPCFHEIHDRFQAELDTLDQLSDSLYDIEKMSCDMSIKTNEQSIHNELDDYCKDNNDFNLKTIFNASYSNDGKSSKFSKLNALSTNITSVDKTITGFSIQMFEQLIKDEELRAKQHHTVLRLREKSLINRLQWEVTMYDLQVRRLKNRPIHEKQLQLLKQKQRGSVKKLEHSLSQIKRLGRVIDTVYKQRIIMLEEHLQHLRAQSSSKKVIRKLKSLDQMPKIEEYTYWSQNNHEFKPCSMTHIVDTVENENVNLNPIEFSVTSNNTTPNILELNKYKVILRNQATSPINIETKLFKQIENVEVQTDDDWSLQSTTNKTMPTSKTFDNGNLKSFVPINLPCINDLSDCLTKDEESLLILPTNSDKLIQCLSETSIGTNSEQSDMDIHISTLQKQLEAKKLESVKLKREQKKLRLENLKAKEQDLLKEIELYDKKIEESKRSLMVEIQKKNVQAKSSLKLNYSKKSTSSIFDNIINYNNDETSENINKHRIMPTNDKEYDHNINVISPQNQKHVCEIQQKLDIKTNDNINSCTKNCASKKIKNFTLLNQYPSLETNQVSHKVVLLHNKSTVIENNTLNELHDIKTKTSNIILKSPVSETSIYTLPNVNESFKEQFCINEKNDTPNISLNDKDLYFENSTEKSTASNDNINYSNTKMNLSDSNKNNIRKNLFVDYNKIDNEVCEKNKIFSGEINILNNGIEADDTYSPDFMSDESSSECQKSYEFNRNNDNMVELLEKEQSNESSYEEERSEGDVMFEDKTFIEHFSNNSNLVQNKISGNANVDTITNSIFNSLLKDTSETLKYKMNKPLFVLGKSDFNNLTEETPLLMILKREEEHQNLIFHSEQATAISDIILKHHLLPIIYETVQMYLPNLNNIEIEKLTLYLKWSSKRNKFKLSELLNYQHNTSDVGNDESFEMFYQKYQNQKCLSFRTKSNNDETLSLNQQEAEKLKLEQMRIEEEIEHLCMSEESQFFLREIPNKPPPPYKSPTKYKSFVDMPYTSNEICEIVLIAASQLFNDSESPIPKNYIIISDSSLQADYKTLIFDYCKEITKDIYIDDQSIPIWIRPMSTLKKFQARPENAQHLSDIIMKNLRDIIEIEECEEKVNTFVVKQMHKEDSSWTDFQIEEMEIQNEIVQNLMKKLICNTLTNIKTNCYSKFML